MPKINQEEYEVLKELDDKWKWIARGEDQQTYAHEYRPIKSKLRGQWESNWIDYYPLPHDWFQFIQWEDEEPYLIDELIKEYKYSTEHISHVVNERVKALGKAWSESEETEVKILESIREEIWEEMLHLEDKRKNQWADIKYQTLREVLQKLGHLDEPEVLSQEWIGKNVEYAYFDMLDGSGRLSSATAIIKPKKLQNLLVPKQEEADLAYHRGFKEGERQTAEYFESITEEPSKEQVWKYLSEHGIEVVEKDPLAAKVEERNNKQSIQYKFPEGLEKILAYEPHDPIKPAHYRKGEIDLFESWYRTRPFNEFRAIMESIAERYMKRDKTNRVEDLEKAIYVLTRLKEYEEIENEK